MFTHTDLFNTLTLPHTHRDMTVVFIQTSLFTNVGRISWDEIYRQIIGFKVVKKKLKERENATMKPETFERKMFELEF